MKKYCLISIVATLMLLCSCSEEKIFQVNGNISGASNSKVLLEYSKNGFWAVIDSTRTDSEGNFELEVEAFQHPEIFRLSVEGKSVYFPVDSTETIKINSNLKNFNTEYSISGNNKAEALASIDKKINKFFESKLKDDEKALNELKKEVYNFILKDPSSLNSYYLINKNIKGKPFLDISDSRDRGVFCAVATAFKSYKPNDPRTKPLENAALQAQKQYLTYSSSMPTDTINAEIISYHEIILPDINNTKHKLSEELAKNKVTILSFTDNSLAPSSDYDFILSNIFSKYKGKGLGIYQIGLNNDLVSWKIVAKNLPWVAVYDADGYNSNYRIKYNVGDLPATFVFRGNELEERVIDLSTLEKVINKNL